MPNGGHGTPFPADERRASTRNRFMKANRTFFLLLLGTLPFLMMPRAFAQPLTAAVQPQITPAFTDAERAQIIGYWNENARYEIGPRDGVEKNGAWAVRLTPDGSAWLWRYQKFLTKQQLPPTFKGDLKPENAEAVKWESWVRAKIAFDRWRAAQDAASLNGQNPPPESAPIFPGLIPAALEKSVGAPPPFAAAVAPRKFTVRFDDGYIAEYHDNVALGNIRYPYYRFADGVASDGVSLRKMPPENIEKLFACAGMTPFEQHVMRAVSLLEGGFDSINTYDTGFVSVGFIQFASLSEGAGSLGELMRFYKRSDAEHFNADFRRFGLDVADDGTLIALDPNTGSETRGADANAKIIFDKRLIAVFQRAGKQSEAFQIAQLRQAKIRFYPGSFKIGFVLNGQQIGGVVSDVVKSEAGMATLMDRSVNVGNIRLLNTVLPQLMSEKHLTSLSQLSPYEREIIRRVKWREDFLKNSSLTQPQ